MPRFLKTNGRSDLRERLRVQAFQLPHLSEYHRPVRVRSRASREWHVAVAHPFRLGPKFGTVGLSHGQHLFCPAYMSRKEEKAGVHLWLKKRDGMIGAGGPDADRSKYETGSRGRSH